VFEISWHFILDVVEIVSDHMKKKKTRTC